MKRELHNQSHVESDGDLNTQITSFRNQLKDKMEYLELVESLNSSLVVKEHQYKQELLDARKESINVIFPPSLFCQMHRVMTLCDWSTTMNTLSKIYLHILITDTKCKIPWPHLFACRVYGTCSEGDLNLELKKWEN